MASRSWSNSSTSAEPDGLAARLREISDSVLEVTSELDLDRLLQKLVDSAKELVGARYAALGVLSPNGSALRAFVVSGMTAAEIKEVASWPKGRGLLGVLLREPKPLRVRDISRDPRSAGFPPGHPPMTSFLGVPLRSGDGILGNFYLTEKLTAPEFSQEDEDIIVLFASHAAVAIGNARRFAQTNERLSETLEENEKLIDRLQAALAERDEFISVATHELKTPITVLRGYVQALTSQKAPSLRERALEAIERQTTRLVNLIDQLLDASRIGAGRLELTREDFDLVALSRDVVERFTLTAPERASQIQMDLPREAIPGNWDRGRLEQVLTNLVSNALKYSPNSGEVRLSVRRTSRGAEVSVSDRGIGIPSEQQADIFEPFRRGSNAREKRIDGAGLGLHISKDIVDAHGGRMWFESMENVGTTFHFELPLDTHAGRGAT